MAEDVKNKGGLDTGTVKNGRITVKSGRTVAKHQNPPMGVLEYTISKFDLGAADTSDATDGTILENRLDDPRYYNGDDPT